MDAIIVLAFIKLFATLADIIHVYVVYREKSGGEQMVSANGMV